VQLPLARTLLLTALVALGGAGLLLRDVLRAMGALDVPPLLSCTAAGPLGLSYLAWLVVPPLVAFALLLLGAIERSAAPSRAAAGLVLLALASSLGGVAVVVAPECGRLGPLSPLLPLILLLLGGARPTRLRQLGPLDLVVIVLLFVVATTMVQQASKVLTTSLARLEASRTVGEEGRQEHWQLSQPLGIVPSAEGVVELPPAGVPPKIERDDPVDGAMDAAVTIFYRGDALDPESARLWGPMHDLVEARRADVRLVWKHRPADASCGTGRPPYVESCLVAVAGACAHAAGRFFSYQDLLLTNPERLEPTDLVAYANEIGLDSKAFERCLEDPIAAIAVRRDLVEGAADEAVLWVGDRGFPRGATVEALVAAVGQALLGAGVPPLEAPVGRSVVAKDLRSDEPASVSLQGFAMDRWPHVVDGGLGLGRIPVWATSTEAHEACAAAGQRLCTTGEWLTACEGREVVDTDFDGDLLDERYLGRRRPPGTFAPASSCPPPTADEVVGATPGCRTVEGVEDLVGRPQWVDAGPGVQLALGGGAECRASDRSTERALVRCCASLR
jgi:hypothetical protein